MRDLFAMARATMTVPMVWDELGLPGAPTSSCCSPFRHDLKPSFSIYGEGRKWKDHGTDEGGDVVEFVKTALGGYREARKWFQMKQRRGGCVTPLPIKATVGEDSNPPVEPRRPVLDLEVGTAGDWRRLAHSRGLSISGICDVVGSGILGFTWWDGIRCFAVTDGERRAAEIRALDGRMFPLNHGHESKAAPLPGVDKSWLPGSEVLSRADAEEGVLVCEGATDLLTAWDLRAHHRGDGCSCGWIPVAVLGASCRTLAEECAELISGRRVRLCFDSDEAGAKAAKHWGGMFSELGCIVDEVLLPDGMDLGDAAPNLNPEDLFCRE